MKVVDKKLLRKVSERVICENCGRPGPTDPHHLFTRGSGRVDVSENLLALCRECHNGFHSCGKPSRNELLAISAKKHKTTPEKIMAKVYRLRRK
jgi:5-methylcytosine-specific restriction endonuclease McrA